MAALRGHVLKNVWSCALDATGRVLITGGGDSSIKLWDIEKKTRRCLDTNKEGTRFFCSSPQLFETNIIIKGSNHDMQILDSSLSKHVLFENRSIDSYGRTNFNGRPTTIRICICIG